MESNPLRRNIFQRLFGMCATQAPADHASWTCEGNEVTVDLGRVPELSQPNQAVRLEKKGFPHRLLLIHGPDSSYRAFKNRCTHGGRRLDPIPGVDRVQCCSIGRSTYDYTGKVLSGPAKGPIGVCTVRNENGRLIIQA